MIVALPQKPQKTEKAQTTEQRVYLPDVSWDTYVAFCDSIGERHVRMTYDRGDLEIMSLSPQHEHRKKRLGRFVEVLTLEMEIDISSFGSMTCRKKGLLRALEPDDCYWITHEAEVRGREKINLDIDPPPDLSLEIEVSQSVMDRMGIYAALKIPEVWRWDGETLHVHLLGPRGSYRTSKRSKAFSFLPLDEFRAFLTRTEIGETTLMREFRDWVRENRGKWKK